jgi:hypothetical protein
MSHVYVIEFDGGLIKVGRTSYPDQRIKTHESTVCNFTKKKIVNKWISSKHGNAKENELKMISFCSSTGESTGSREWFKGVSFFDVVAFSESLIFDKSMERDPRRYYEVSAKFAHAEIEMEAVSRAYSCAIKLESYIVDSLWIGGDIFQKTDSGHSTFCAVLAAYFLSGDPIELLIDAVEGISVHPEDQVGVVHRLYSQALSYVRGSI